MVIDWSKAPEDATHYDSRPRMMPSFMRLKQGSDDEWMWWGHQGWQYYGLIGDSCLMAERPRPWSGEGLPPVGTVCEFTHNGEGVEGRWIVCTVLAYGGRGDFGETVAIQTNDELFNDRGGLSIQNNRQAISWRPIRTPEQIAAEEHKKSVNQLIEDTDYILDETSAQAVLAAGYRKQEPKPE